MNKDKPPVRVMRKGHTLWARDAASAEAIDALKEYDTVTITIKKRRRTADQNAGYWAMLQRVIDATNAFPDTELFHDAIKMALNVTELRKTLGGEVYMIPGSTRNMDVAAFSKFWNDAQMLIAEKFGIDVQELRAAA